MMYSAEEIHTLLKKNLTEKRYNHSVLVADYARELALRFKIDTEKAYLAGLLHDCAKRYDDNEMLQIAGEAHLSITDAEKRQPVALLHARLSAYIARRDYGIEDEVILQAIAFHQSGGVGMTALDKIVGLADSTEPSRNDEGLEKIRVILQSDLHRAYLEKFIYTMIKVVQGRYLLDRDKADIYNYLVIEEDKAK